MRYEWRQHKKALGADILKTESAVVFAVGRTTYTREDIARKLGHTHVSAMRRLERAIRVCGRFTSMRDALLHVDLESLARQRGIGTVSLYAYMSIIWALGHDPIAWTDWTPKAGTLATRVRRSRRRAKSKA